MNLIDRVISTLSPQWGRDRLRARVELQALMSYNAATKTSRGSVFRRSASDADTASARRDVLAYSARDLVRNTPFAKRAQDVIVHNTVGDGIVWKVQGGTAAERKRLAAALKRQFDSTEIDADGRQNLYGLQGLALRCVVESGEVLVRRRRRYRSDGLALPFQIQLLEPDFIDTGKVATTGEPQILEGIEYDALGRRAAYWLFDEHPGAMRRFRGNRTSRRVPASEILHIYRQERPGQQRGVSWFAPIALKLMDLDDYDDAQVMRQKIAACFAAFVTDGGGSLPATASVEQRSDPLELGTIKPGRVQKLAPDQGVTFATPPGVDGYDEFTRGVLRSAAAAMGITYEAMTGDLSRVNFSSARMGRLEMDRAISQWQWLMLVPQLLEPIGRWAIEAMALQTGQTPSATLSVSWTPPARMIVDPAREVPAMIEKIAGGLASWQQVVRELGYDPQEMLDEHIEDRKRFAEAGLSFTSVTGGAGAAGNARGTGGAGAPQTGTDAGDDDQEDDSDDEGQ